MVRLCGLFSVLILQFLIFSAAPSGFAVAREQVKSEWTEAAPTIDGEFRQGEWANLQIAMRRPVFPLEAYAYFENDASNLYVLVDSVGDTTNRGEQYSGDRDECLLVFNFDDPVTAQIFGAKGTIVNASIFGAMGFGPSSNSTRNHRICEFSIPLEYIRASPGQSIDFCSPEKRGRSITYDAATGADNIWPKKLVFSDRETWGTLTIAQAPQTQTTTAVVETTIQQATTTTQQATILAETVAETKTTQLATSELVPFGAWAIVGVAIVVIGALALYAVYGRKKNT